MGLHGLLQGYIYFILTYFIIIIILLQLGVHLVAVDLNADTGKGRLYIKGIIQNKVHTINKVHAVQIQTYEVTQGHFAYI
jgi:hypothetical protein